MHRVPLTNAQIAAKVFRFLEESVQEAMDKRVRNEPPGLTRAEQQLFYFGVGQALELFHNHYEGTLFSPEMLAYLAADVAAEQAAPDKVH